MKLTVKPSTESLVASKITKKRRFTTLRRMFNLDNKLDIMERQDIQITDDQLERSRSIKNLRDLSDTLKKAPSQAGLILDLVNENNELEAALNIADCKKISVERLTVLIDELAEGEETALEAEEEAQADEVMADTEEEPETSEEEENKDEGVGSASEKGETEEGEISEDTSEVIEVEEGEEVPEIAPEEGEVIELIPDEEIEEGAPESEPDVAPDTDTDVDTDTDTKTDDEEETTVSNESILVTLVAVLAFYFTFIAALGAIIVAWLTSLTSLLSQLREVSKGVIRDINNVDKEKFSRIRVMIIPKRRYKRYIEGLKTLGQEFEKQINTVLTKSPTINVDKIADIYKDMGIVANTETGNIKPMASWNYVTGTYGDLEYEPKDIIDAYNLTDVAIVQALRTLESLKKASQASKMKIKELKGKKKSGEMDKITYKQEIRKVKNDMKVWKKFLQNYISMLKDIALSLITYMNKFPMRAA